MPVDEALAAVLKKQQYYIVGEHSGVKLCHWMKQSLTAGRQCYKADFYGIDSHRCLQMTPSVDQCNCRCMYCWRYQGNAKMDFDSVDDPEFILDEAIRGQRKLVSGYKGNHKTDMEKWEEAQEPNMVAISLAGEPTLYPKLGEFIQACHDRDMTTFLVTNGTTPEVLETLDPLPKQLYVSVDAPNEEIFKKLCVPLIPNGWERVLRTLEILPSLDTRKVVRHTLVQGHNIGWEEEYAELDRIAGVEMVEPKGYVFVGYSRQRLTIDQMPSHETVRAFGEKLADLLGYVILKEKPDSRVVLVGKEGIETKFVP